jgi:hypothetical protein
VIGPDTQAVIDGYTRSASTFAVYAFQLAQPRPVRLAHHLHASAQLVEAARRGLPTLLVIRDPKGAVLSHMVREPDVDLVDALHAYRRFHEALLPVRDSLVVGRFDEVTHEFATVVRRLNARFGTGFGVFGGSGAELAEVRRMIGFRPTLSPVLLGFESGLVSRDEARRHVATLEEQREGVPDWIPSPDRERSKEALREKWDRRELRPLRQRAERVYQAFCRPARSGVPGEGENDS